VNDVVNLNKARKAKARADAAVAAARNRLVHGQTKSEKAAVSASRAKADRILDAHKRDP
jgi:hypothetical protein